MKGSEQRLEGHREEINFYSICDRKPLEDFNQGGSVIGWHLGKLFRLASGESRRAKLELGRPLWSPRLEMMLVLPKEDGVGVRVTERS